MMRKIFFFLLPLIFSLQSPPKVFAVVQKWPVKLHSNSSVSLEGGESNNILFDSDVTTIYNKLTVYADVDFDFSTEFELAAKSLEELEVDVFDAETSQPSPPPPNPPSPRPNPPPWPNPPPPNPPPPPGPITPIPDASWHDFVKACLDEAPVTGECTTWASGNNYGTMPNWDTSLVTDMSGWDGNAFSGFGDRSTFNGDISNWDTSSVTTMSYMFKGASAFNQDISSWTGTAATTAQVGMFDGATAFQDKFLCTEPVTGPASSCVLRQSYWSASSCPLGSWVYNNEYTTHETNPGSVGTPEACIDLVRTECPTAKIANMGSEGECWCQYHDGSVTEIVATDENNWMSCLLS